MKVLILAAGYATRLYPLTMTQPKPLLPVAGKPMIEHVLDNLAPMGGIDRVYVNARARNELRWRPQYDFAHVLARLQAGKDPRSPLAQLIGSKGYHAGAHT